MSKLKSLYDTYRPYKLYENEKSTQDLDIKWRPIRDQLKENFDSMFSHGFLESNKKKD